MAEQSADMPRDIDAAATALDHMSDAFYVLDRDWRFVYLNPVAATQMGSTVADLLGTVVWESFPEVTGTTFEQRFRHAVATGEPAAFEARYEPFGQWFEVRIFPDDSGLSVFFREVTTRHEAEAALRDSERRLRQVLDSLPVGVWVADAQGTILSANPAGSRIWAGERDVGPEQYGVYQGWWPESGVPLAPEDWAMARVLRSGQSILGEVIDIQAFDGTRKTIRNAAVPIRDPQGTLTGIIAINEDITEQRRAELELAASRAHMQRLFEAGLLGIAVGDSQGMIHEINDELLRITGRTREQVQAGLRWTDITPPEHRERDRRAIAEATLHGRSTPYEQQLLRPDGSRVWVMMGLLSAGTHGDERISVAIDIDARKRAEVEREATLARERAARAELERERQRLVRLQRLTAALAASATVDSVARAILEEGMTGLGAICGLICLRAEDDNQVIMLVRAEGYAPETVSALQRVSLATPSPLTEAIHTGAVVMIEQQGAIMSRFPTLQETVSGRDIHAIVAAPLTVRDATIGGMSLSFGVRPPFTPEEQSFFQAVAGLCGAALERAQLYDATGRARAAAEAASRAKDEFLSVISHELRTPLTPIAAYAELLRGGRLSGARASEALAAIERNARVEARLVEDLLDASRIITGKLTIVREPLNMATAIAAAVSAAAPAAEAAGVALEWTAPAGTLIVNGDSARLQQVIANLLTNAIKFTPAAGRVKVTLDQEGPDAVLTVRDTGAGIAPAFLPFVFDRFRQEDSTHTRRRGGLGLGLAIVSHLVELHGGRVAAASGGPGQGASFTVRLPCTVAPVRPATSPDEGATGRATGALAGLRLLAVDDDIDTLRLLDLLLTSEGATVHTATSAPEARALAARCDPHVLIADIGLPGEDGYALMHDLRAQRGLQNLPAVALTAYAAEEDRRHALSAGFQAHVAKPMHPAGLVAVIARVAGGPPP